MITTPAQNQLLAIISTDIDSVSVTSKTSTSYVKRFKIRPSGVVSKYDMGASKTFVVIDENNPFAALAPPLTAHSDLRNVAKKDTARIHA
mmetsp:Transcript_34143/g.52405  ORF Transcript_34143/g.52405 Transcript_34143/m.52405 type:complete len:90 (+) Transcript_34143:1374-1643(+)